MVPTVAARVGPSRSEQPCDVVSTRGATGVDDAATVEFGSGAQTAHGVDEYAATGALARTAASYAAIRALYGRRVGAER